MKTNKKLINEINRVRSLMLLNEQGPGTLLFKETLKKYIKKGGIKGFMDEFADLFPVNKTTSKQINSIGDDIREYGDEAIDSLTDNELELLFRARNPKVFSEFLLDSFGVKKNIDDLFAQVDGGKYLSGPNKGREVDIDSLVEDLKDGIDQTPGLESLDDIPNLRDDIYNYIDECADLAREGNFNNVRGLTDNIDMRKLLDELFNDASISDAILRLPNGEATAKKFIRENLGKTQDEVAENLQKYLDEIYKKYPESSVVKKIDELIKYAGDKKIVIMLKKFQAWYVGKYGYNTMRKLKGKSIVGSFLSGPGKALLTLDLILILLVNTLDSLFVSGKPLARKDYDEFYAGFGITIITLILKWLGAGVSQVQSNLLDLSTEDAEDFAKNNERLKQFMAQTKNDYIFEKQQGELYVKMINFGEGENIDSDFIIYQTLSGIQYDTVTESNWTQLWNKINEKFGN